MLTLTGFPHSPRVPARSSGGARLRRALPGRRAAAPRSTPASAIAARLVLLAAALWLLAAFAERGGASFDAPQPLAPPAGLLSYSAGRS